MSVLLTPFHYQANQACFKQLSQLPGVELYHAHVQAHSFDAHAHHTFGIGTVEHGVQRFRHGGRDHLAGKGSLVLMNPDVVHTGAAETAAGWCYCMLYIEPEALATLTGGQGHWFRDVLRQDPQRAWQLSQLLAGLWHSQDGLSIDAMLLSVTELLQPHISVGALPARVGAHRFNEVNAYLRSEFASVITLSDLAALVSLSPYHFQRLYKAQHHVSPQQMLMAIRLNEAKRLLSQGVPAAQVAAGVGLTDQAHLTRAFARRYGLTPGRYQKQVMA
ncbi:MAG: AraC family transcriptional regulator [Neisseriaceae bacterium]|nr:AraC family transcriptional regulator [Neisseriaceae bacterium]